MTSQDQLSGSSGPLYGRLRAGEIRLLYLEPNADKSSIVRGRLEPCSLMKAATEKESTAYTFEALSYTWGNSSCQAMMIMNGVQVIIGSNLAAFLAQRRESNQEVVLWVDALCINQSDTLDKNQQVSQMGMVYAAAARLTIWLGPSADKSTLALNELQRLGSESVYDKMPILPEDASEAISRLFKRPWWKRTWIIQEVVFGGMNSKITRMRIQCGPDSILWSTLVIAAVRMKAHQDDLRQYLPEVSSIMELDSLRDSLGTLISDPGVNDFRFELLCRFRRFLATDPRDKVYALYNLFNMFHQDSIETRYEASVEDVYLEFARSAIASRNGLEILRHCSSTTRSLPSWVPDWSHHLPHRPLPARRCPRFFDVPWWAEPIRETEDDKSLSAFTGEKPRATPKYKLHQTFSSATLTERHRKLRLKRLELSVHGAGVVESFNEIPASWNVHKMPEVMKDAVEELASSKKLIFCVSDDRLEHFDDDSTALFLSPLHQGELLTERRMKSWVLQRLNNASYEPPYCATLSEEHDAHIEPHSNTLTLSGIVFEDVEVSHEPFVNDLEHDWKRATSFMVALGCCKKLATSHDAAKSRYRSQKNLLRAFWSTIFTGNPTPSQYRGKDTGDPLIQCTEWLPEIPESWSWACPSLTTTISGQLDLAEQSQAAKQVIQDINEAGGEGEELKMESLIQFDGLIPEDWTHDERELYRVEFLDLGKMWKEQPYDLYQRPFDLFHVIPDPYWQSRKESMAKDGQRIQNKHPAMFSTVPSDDDAVKDMSERLLSQIRTRLSQMPTMQPSETLWPGVEKYALGRRFFITRDGYFGLGPSDTQHGDRIALLLGSTVPFVLRKVCTDSGQVAWKLVGETYVHGIMRGELVLQGGVRETRAEQITLI